MNLIYIRYIYTYEGKNINNKINETFILLIILASNQINDIIIYHNLNIYQFLFHFGPPLPGILTRPRVVLRPFDHLSSNDTERGRG